MSKHRSFRPSDFSLRDIPLLLVSYIIISLLCILCGLFLELFSPFVRGLLLGLGLGCMGALFLLRDKRPIDVASLPKPSEKVRKMCADPDCTFPSSKFVEAVKVYRAETGLHLTEATAALKAYIAEQQSVEN